MRPMFRCTQLSKNCSTLSSVQSYRMIQRSVYTMELNPTYQSMQSSSVYNSKWSSLSKGTQHIALSQTCSIYCNSYSYFFVSIKKQLPLTAGSFAAFLGDQNYGGSLLKKNLNPDKSWRKFFKLAQCFTIKQVLRSVGILPEKEVVE